MSTVGMKYASSLLRSRLGSVRPRSRQRNQLFGAFEGFHRAAGCDRLGNAMMPTSERLLRNLARRLDQAAPGVAASILEGLDEILTMWVKSFRGNCAARRSMSAAPQKLT
jgi:hypothetical protein